MSVSNRYRVGPRSYRLRFLLISAGIVLLLCGILAVVFWRIEHLRRDALELRASEVARETANNARQVLTSCLASEQDICQALTSDLWTETDRHRYLLQALAHHPEFVSLIYLSGDRIVSAGPDPGPARALREAPAPRSVISGEPFSIAYSRSGPLSPCVQVAVEAHDSKQTRQGLLLASVRPESLVAALGDTPRRQMRRYVFDSAGQMVSSDLDGGAAPIPGLIRERGIQQALAGVDSSGAILRRSGPRGRYAGSFIHFQVGAQPAWAAVSVEDVQLGMKPLEREKWLDWRIFLGALFVWMLLIWTQTGSLAQVVRRLQRAAQAVAGGDIGYRLKISTGTDLDSLIDAFNNMAERLQAHQDLLHDRNQQLNVLLRVVAGLRPERDPEELLRRITQDAAGLTLAGVAFLAQVEDDHLRAMEWWNRLRWMDMDARWSMGQGVCGWVWMTHDTRASEDYRSDPYASVELARTLNLRNYVCAPIVLPMGDTVGVLFVGNKASDAAFTEDDIRIMELLARHAGVALEVEAAFLRERRIGATLQKAMLPDVDPGLGGLSIATRYQAASEETELGGDFYDVIDLSPDRIGIVIADVSGKGVRAAVQTAATKYALRAYALENSDPTSVLGRLNMACCAGPNNRGFVSLFYGVIDLRTWQMRFANAGHEHPLLRHANGSVDPLQSEGVVLGVVESSAVSFASQVVTLKPGDTLVLYTDGLSEARRDDEFLETEGVQALLASVDMDAQETAKFLVSEATEFAGGQLHDDIALLVVKIPMNGPVSPQSPGARS